MRNFLILSFLLLAGCKESGSSLAAVNAGNVCSTSVGIAETDIYDVPSSEVLLDGTLQPIGNCIAQQGNFAWVQDAVDGQYHYAVNLLDGSIAEGDSLVFADGACTSPLGQEYAYPLHLSGDVYLFSFEGVLYDYVIGGPFGDWVPAGAYFRKTPGGSCNPFVSNGTDVRVVAPSAFARIFSGPVSL